MPFCENYDGGLITDKVYEGDFLIGNRNTKDKSFTKSN